MNGELHDRRTPDDQSGRTVLPSDLTASLLGADDPRAAITRWCADRLRGLAVLFTRDQDATLVAAAVADGGAGAAIEGDRVARPHLLRGQVPDVTMPDEGQFRLLDPSEVPGTFLAEWHPSRSAPGLLAGMGGGAVLWVTAPDVAVAATDREFLDTLTWARVVLAARRRQHDAELASERTSSAAAGQQDELARTRQILDRVELAVGNELRDTARRLQGWLRLATSNDMEAEVQDEMIRKVSVTADQLAAQIGDLLDGLENAAAERREAELVDLNGVAAWVRETLADLIDERRARIVTSRLPSVQGSPSDFRRILLELVRNALEHGGRFVEVVIHTTELAGGTLELQVADNGPGIAEDSRETVFEPGFQTGGGAGFGLTRVRLLVEGRRGSITVEQSDSGGCLVRTRLPDVLRGMQATRTRRA